MFMESSGTEVFVNLNKWNELIDDLKEVLGRMTS